MHAPVGNTLYGGRQTGTLIGSFIKTVVMLDCTKNNLSAAMFSKSHPTLYICHKCKFGHPGQLPHIDHEPIGGNPCTGSTCLRPRDLHRRDNYRLQLGRLSLWLFSRVDASFCVLVLSAQLSSCHSHELQQINCINNCWLLFGKMCCFIIGLG